MISPDRKGCHRVLPHMEARAGLGGTVAVSLLACFGRVERTAAVTRSLRLDVGRPDHFAPPACLETVARETVAPADEHVARCGPRWRLPLETSPEHSAKSEGMIRPVTLWSGRGCYLLSTPPQPKHDAWPCPLGCCFLTEVLLQALLEPLGISLLVFGCGWVQEYVGQSP
jgi:hypothetical protein